MHILLDRQRVILLFIIPLVFAFAALSGVAVDTSIAATVSDEDGLTDVTVIQRARGVVTK